MCVAPILGKLHKFDLVRQRPKVLQRNVLNCQLPNFQALMALLSEPEALVYIISIKLIQLITHLFQHRMIFVLNKGEICMGLSSFEKEQ